MILADKIINERKKNGWSQEDLAEMLDVSRQSVSKWEGAQSVPDLQKILKMAEIFGVSTDYLLKDEMEPETRTASETTYTSSEPITPLRTVSLEEASEFISIKKKILPVIGIGVVLCITCPLILILLAGLSTNEAFNLSSNTAALIGIIFLFLQLAIAVFIFVMKSGKMKKFEYIERESFETGYGVTGMVKEKMAAEEGANSLALAAGVLLCLLCPVPLIITSVLGLPGYVITSMVCILLIMVAAAVYIFISKVAVFNSYKMLLQEGDYSKENKRKEGKLENVTRIYWLAIVVVYLAVSFTTQRWDLTWIIWAVSGVLFALIKAITVAVIKD